MKYTHRLVGKQYVYMAVPVELPTERSGAAESRKLENIPASSFNLRSKYLLRIRFSPTCDLLTLQKDGTESVRPAKVSFEKESTRNSKRSFVSVNDRLLLPADGKHFSKEECDKLRFRADISPEAGEKASLDIK